MLSLPVLLQQVSCSREEELRGWLIKGEILASQVRAAGVGIMCPGAVSCADLTGIAWGGVGSMKMVSHLFSSTPSKDDPQPVLQALFGGHGVVLIVPSHEDGASPFTAKPKPAISENPWHCIAAGTGCQLRLEKLFAANP